MGNICKYGSEEAGGFVQNLPGRILSLGPRSDAQGWLSAWVYEGGCVHIGYVARHLVLSTISIKRQHTMLRNHPFCAFMQSTLGFGTKSIRNFSKTIDNVVCILNFQPQMSFFFRISLVHLVPKNKVITSVHHKGQLHSKCCPIRI